MTPEARLDRLERIAKLFVRAGLRAREQSREQDGKISILINLQIDNEERFSRQGEDIRMLISLQALNEERFARTDSRFAQLAEAQAGTGRRLDSLIEIIREDRNGNSK